MSTFIKIYCIEHLSTCRVSSSVQCCSSSPRHSTKANKWMNSLMNKHCSYTGLKRKWTIRAIMSYCHDQFHFAKNICILNLVCSAVEEIPRITQLKFYPWHSCFPWHIQLCLLFSAKYSSSVRQSTHSPLNPTQSNQALFAMISLEVSTPISNSSRLGSNAPMSKRVLAEDAKRQRCVSPGLSTHILPNIYRISF